MSSSVSRLLPGQRDLTRTNHTATRRNAVRRVGATYRTVRAYLPRWETTERDRAGLRFGAIAGLSFLAGVVFAASIVVAN